MPDDTYRLQLNNLAQPRRKKVTHEITTAGPRHNEVHTCIYFIDGIQYGVAGHGRTKDEAREAAARSAHAELLAQLLAEAEAAQ